ncbi:ejaculatory bulb-specific protein 3-like [Bacillus rossius redtenbacheri]|uniref:ejaculatory bulb-specific protein 3-like n=1 Tax=Bacillus rossius redtenbacheri TaxID=93214 RepID=UPI002FDD3501
MSRSATVALFAAVAAVSGSLLPDPQQLVKDEAALGKYTACLLGGDTCEPWTEEAKRYIPSALKEGCKDCPQEHKNFYRVVTIHLKQNQPEVYNALAKHYDKDGVYEKKVLEFVYDTN